MADTTVTIKLTPTEYRLVRNELDMLKDDLKKKLLPSSKVPGLTPADKKGIRQRAVALEFLLDKI